MLPTLADYVSEQPNLITLDAETSVREAVRAMVKAGVGATAVTTYGRVVGVLTERDVLKGAVSACLDLDATPIRDVMTSKVVTGERSTPTETMIALMHWHGCRHALIRATASDRAFCALVEREQLLLRSRPAAGRSTKRPTLVRVS